MNTLKLLGIQGDKKYKAWKEQALLAMLSSNINAKLVEVNDVDDIMSYNIESVPALLLNNKLILKQNNHLPDLEEIEDAIFHSLRSDKLRMKKIVVPTDFTEVAKNAYKYAKELAKELDAELKVVNVFYPEASAGDGKSFKSVEEVEKEREDALDEFIQGENSQQFEGIIEDEFISRELVNGFPPDVLLELSEKEETDLIVMGTRSQKGSFDKLLGSVSSKTAQNANCPVWLVPPEAEYKPIKNILYASNFESSNKKMVDRMIDFAGVFDANIHMVNVHKSKWKGDVKFDNHILEQLFRKNGRAIEFRMTTVESETVWEGLYAYANEHNIDAIVLVTKQRSFWENLFHKSITKEMVMRAQIPLVIFHQDF